MTENRTVQIGEAKGRPMLHWVGKRPLDYVTAFPAQLVELFDPTGERQTSEVSETSEVSGNLLFHGDNKDVLAWLLAHGYRGKVDLVYIDPPFDSGADYVRRVELRGGTGTSRFEGQAYTLGEQIQYTDIWVNDMYLQFMYERLLLLRELLREDGSIWLHCDWRMVHRLRLLLDEVFGEGNFINEVSWKHTVLGGTHGRRLPKAHETILWYGKSQDYAFHEDAESARVPFGDYIQKTLRQDEDKRWYYTRGRMSRQPSPEELASRAHTRTYVDDPDAGTLASDVWDDLLAYRVYGDESTAFPTQKNEALVERFVELGSCPGDLVLDCFVGSGTTAAVAQRLGRRWIAADINKGAIQITSKRLQTVIQEQIEAGAAPQQLAFQTQQTSEVSDTSEVCPAALFFSVYRVNDYDLQVQHNEAVNLAVEHIGIQRARTDTYFDGTLGTRLVKIVPFNHPLTLLDLQLLQDELKARPDEERDVVLVCLGKETSIDPWLEDHNKRHPVNRIEVIELRTDQKYGKFFVHQPARAQVRIQRQTSGVSETSEVLVVEIEDFISPTIVERLEMDTPLFKVQIPDWRAMVDVVLVDTSYNGEVFNIILSDVPERKNDLVSGRYELPAPEGATTVAVKIIDMLGEEVLITAEV